LSQIPKNTVGVSFKHITIDGRTFEGDFTFKVILSANEEDAIGRNRRAMLGGHVAHDGVLDSSDILAAQARAEITIRAVPEIPTFWASQGADLPREVIELLYEDMTMEINKTFNSMAKKVEEARSVLRLDRERRRKENKDLSGV